MLILPSYTSYIHTIFQKKSNDFSETILLAGKKKEREEEKYDDQINRATSPENGLIKTRSETSCSSKPFVRSASNISSPPSWKVSRWKSSRFSGVFHRRRQVVEFLPPASTFTSHSSFRPRFRGGERGGETSVPPPPANSSVSELGGAVELVVYQKRKRGLGRPAGDEV